MTVSTTAAAVSSSSTTKVSIRCGAKSTCKGKIALYGAGSTSKVRAYRVSARGGGTYTIRLWSKQFKYIPAGGSRTFTVRVTETKPARVKTRSTSISLRRSGPAPTASTPTPSPVPTSTDEGSAESPCGSNTPLKEDGTPYVCSFADDFSGSSLNRDKWVPAQTEMSGHSLGGDCWVDDPDNIIVSGGTLKLISRRESAPFTCKSPSGDFTTQYTSGSVSTGGNFSQTYGLFAFRAKFPDAKVIGSHSALWLYPYGKASYGDWPASGEIDVAEYYTKYPDRAIPTIHYFPEDPSIVPITNVRCMIADPWNFHVYQVEWTESAITFTYDGTVCMKHTINPAAPLTGSQPFDKPFDLILSQVLGSGSNAFDPASTPLPLTTTVDWVRVWK